VSRKPRSSTREGPEPSAPSDGERIAEPQVEPVATNGARGGDDSIPLAALLEAPVERAQGDGGDGGDGAGAWRSVLGAGTPRQVLARLVDGDPLGIRRVVTERLRERAWLADADLVFLRAVARCAWFSARYRCERDFARCLRELVDEAVLDTVREDLEAARGGEGAEAADRELAAWSDLARPLGLDPRAARTAAAVFDHLPEPERRAFFALAIDGRALDDAARASKSSPSDCARAARRAFDAVLAALDVEPTPTARKDGPR
jgi:DNA-directed RNA polymerase specialized sigma24 family protein